jgi:hypothetical protein
MLHTVNLLGFSIQVGSHGGSSVEERIPKMKIKVFIYLKNKLRRLQMQLACTISAELYCL